MTKPKLREDCIHINVCHVVGEYGTKGCTKSCPEYVSTVKESSDKVLDELERRISGRYKELTELLPCETAKEMCKILALIGENEAMWAQIKELRTKEREQNG